MSTYGGCAVGDGIAICVARRFLNRAVLRCPSCRVKRRFIEQSEPYYEFRRTCLHCGYQWSSEVGRVRSSAKQKQKRRNEYRAMWAKVMTRKQAQQAEREYMGW